MRSKIPAVVTAAFWLATATTMHAQGGPAATAQAAALVDLTGYWVSIVTEDWRFRRLTPAKGGITTRPA